MKIKNAVLALTLVAVNLGQAHAEDLNAGCRLPFERMGFPIQSVINTVPSAPAAQTRYIVADLNTQDESGTCRGVHEAFTKMEHLSDFSTITEFARLLGTTIQGLSSMNWQAAMQGAQPVQAVHPAPAPEPKRRSFFGSGRSKSTSASPSRQSMSAKDFYAKNSAQIHAELEDLANYNSQVAPYATSPIRKGGYEGGYCVGQKLYFCELRNNVPTLVYLFITSSNKYVPDSSYYAPINYINTRHWDPPSDRAYTAVDAARDARMGGGDGKASRYNGVSVYMPNFMNFLPMPGYAGNPGNGIHEIAGGPDSGGTFGAPVSLGCIRLNDYQAKLARWWTPMNAKFFITFDPSRYVQRGR